VVTVGDQDDVEGVTLEQYARVAVALFGAKEEEVEERAVANGIPPGRMSAIAEEWNRRLAEDRSLWGSYNDHYQAAMREAGITAPEITLEQYAEILGAQQRGEPMEEVLERFGLTMQTYSMVSQEWAGRLISDMSIAMRLGQLLSEAHPPHRPPPGEQPPDQPLQPLL
jgi:hypothetical protein